MIQLLLLLLLCGGNPGNAIAVGGSTGHCHCRTHNQTHVTRVD